YVIVRAPDAASLTVVERLTRQAEKMLAEDPAVQDAAVVDGYDLIDDQFSNSGAVMFVSLKPFEQRKDKTLLSFDTLKRLNAKFAGIRDGFLFAINPPSIPGLGTTGGFEFYAQNRGTGDPRATGQAVEAFLAKVRQRPELAGVSTTFPASSQQLFVDLDRNKAVLLGVRTSDVFQTMQAFFGSQIVGQFSQFSRVWWVIVQADAAYRGKPEDFDKVYLRSSSGAN